MVSYIDMHFAEIFWIDQNSCRQNLDNFWIYSENMLQETKRAARSLVSDAMKGNIFEGISGAGLDIKHRKGNTIFIYIHPINDGVSIFRSISTM